MPFIKVTIFILLLGSTYSSVAAQAIDKDSGLRIAEGYQAVKKHCSGCHSLQLVRQNKASREGWAATIRWMQETQGMALLNKPLEKIILTYLAENYAPENKSRRAPVVIKRWRNY